MPDKNPIKIRKKIFEHFKEKQTQLLRQTIESKESIENNELITNPAINEKNENQIPKAYKKRSMTSKNVNMFIIEDAMEIVVREEYEKEYFKFYEMDLDIKIINFEERDETEEEIIKRKINIETKIKQDNMKIANNQKKSKASHDLNVNTNNLVTIKKIIPLPSDMKMTENIPKFSKWVSSIFQAIKDMEINDAITNENIFSKIYPQVNGLPVYNPNGRYWVKLFHMGKYRKIEIDDLMPCGKYEEFLLPRCDRLEEIWPAILTKALIKLFSYKYKFLNYIHEEIGDCSILYALTGLIGEKISLELTNFTKIEDTNDNKDYKTLQIIQNILSNENYQNSKKFLLGFNPSVTFEDDYKKEENFDLSPIVNSKRNSILEIDTFKKKLSKAIPRKATKSLIVKKNFNISDQEIFNPDVLLSKFSVEKLFRSGRIDEDLKEILLQNLDILPKLNVKSSLFEDDLESEEDEFIKSTNNLINESDSNFQSSNNGNIKNKSNNNTPSNSLLSLNKLNEKVAEDFAYSVVEFFYSEDFNMRRLKPVDFSDLKKKIQEAKVSYKTLTLDQKKNYINSIKEIKQKQKEERLKRIEEIKRPGKKHHLIKIKNDCHEINREAIMKLLNYPLIYNDEEIEMAKKCLLNKWQFPHPDFFNETFINNLEVNYTDVSDDIIRLSSKGGMVINSSWTREFYTTNFAGVDLTKYSTFEEPIKRQNGLWLDLKDFMNLFKSFLVIHNPNYYPHQINVDYNNHNHEEDIFQQSNEYKVFYLSSINDQNENHNSNLQSYNESILSISNNKMNLKKSCLLILFEPNTENSNRNKNNNFDDFNSYANFDLLDSTGHSVLNGETFFLNNLFSCIQYDQMDHDREYFLVLKSSIVPFGYHLRILSDHCIESINYEAYLKKSLNFLNFNHKISFFNLEQNKFYLLARFKLNLNYEDDNNNVIKIIMMANKFNDNYLFQFFEIYLHNSNENSSSNNKRQIYFNQEFTISKKESSDYIISISIKAPFNTADNNLDFDLVYNNSKMKIEILDNVEPFEISDKFVPNKHGIVLKEIIYVPLETILYASLEFNLNDKYEEIKEKIRMKIEIYKKDKLLLSRDFYNNIAIHNFILDNTINLNNSDNEMRLSQEDMNKKGSNVNLNLNKRGTMMGNPKDTTNMNNYNLNNNAPFYIWVYLDLTESPSYLKIFKEFEQHDINWSIRFFTSETIAILKNTIKEDHERNIKEIWESNEPGRYEKAKLARVKFLLQLKKERGDLLTQDEDKIYFETRKRKKSIEENNTNSNTNILNSKNKKIEPNKNKSILILNNPIEINQEIKIESNLNDEKALPIASQHKSKYLKSFLDYTYKDRVIIINTKNIPITQSNDVLLNPAPYCRTEDEILFIKNNIDKRANEEMNKIKSQIENKLKDKNELKENLNKNYERTYKKRNKKRETLFTDLMTKRNQLRELNNVKIDMENRLLDVISTFNYGQCDLQYATTIYKEIEMSKNVYVNETIIKKVFDMISEKKEEIIRNDLKKLTNKDKGAVMKILEDVRSNNWNISMDVMKQLNALS